MSFKSLQASVDTKPVQAFKQQVNYAILDSYAGFISKYNKYTSANEVSIK